MPGPLPDSESTEEKTCVSPSPQSPAPREGFRFNALRRFHIMKENVRELLMGSSNDEATASSSPRSSAYSPGREGGLVQVQAQLRYQQQQAQAQAQGQPQAYTTQAQASAPQAQAYTPQVQAHAQPQAQYNRGGMNERIAMAATSSEEVFTPREARASVKEYGLTPRASVKEARQMRMGSVKEERQMRMGSVKDSKRQHGRGTKKHKNAATGRPVDADTLKVIEEFVNAVVANGVAGFRRDFLELKQNPPTDFTTTAFAANVPNNRYKDVVCIDSTRTVLTLNVPPDTDYIHANWVRMDHSDTVFIAAQAPLDHTIGDFWRLCFQENVTTIVALCNVIECGKRKSTQYWPLETGAHCSYGCMLVINKQVIEEDRVKTYVLEVLPDGYSNSLIVRLMHMSEWPDRGVPEFGFCVLRLLKKIDKAAPCIVHCSAGIGRTGTMIAIDTIVQRLFKCIPTDVKSVVQELRTKRASSVQTEAQYIFIVTTVLSYIKAKMPARFQERADAFRNEVKKAAMV